MNALMKTTDAARELAAELFQRFRAQSQEAEQLALQMIQDGEARLTLSLVLAGDVPSMSLLLEPLAEDGAPLEIASSHPVTPSLEGFQARQWFLCRLSQWNHQH